MHFLAIFRYLQISFAVKSSGVDQVLTKILQIDQKLTFNVFHILNQGRISKIEKKSLMILPPEQNEHKEFAEDILSILSQQATDLGRYDVIDRNLVDEILEEQKFQYSGNVKESDIVELGEMVAAEEALILEIVHFGQKGVPPEKDKDKNDKDETLFGWVVKKTVSAALYDSEKEKARRKEELDNNIQTVVNANVKLVNVETGQTHDSFNLNAEYTLLGPPHIPMIKNIGINPASKNR